ncbi:chemotaxis protein CheD [Clostridium sp. 'deep sea']|uniref:chemotaxis protein CheD n=1 Tax=Clostridium sp. 'deep sea' TaxID=2779445 RepID=UPI001896980C|nr:chemotaxis protein CheD [Clostridium sp. 'deep sea']QOR35338.1 chemotaxis protein CheD [Clostridium sp. 'deep sea']
MKKEFVVGISDYKITKNPNKLITYALGSCVGTVILDPINKIGGLSHILLYDSTLFNKNIEVKKYADTAIPDMVNNLIIYGAKRSNLMAYIAGGAKTFLKEKVTSYFDIGNSNIKAVKQVLKELKIPIVQEDVGGSVGRTMSIDLENLKVFIKYAKHLNDIQVKQL